MFIIPTVRHEYISNFNINDYLVEKYDDILYIYDNFKNKYDNIKFNKIIIFILTYLLIYNYFLINIF